MLGITIHTDNGEVISQTGLSVGLHQDELGELARSGRVRRVFGTTIMSARAQDGIIVQMLWGSEPENAEMAPS